MEMHIHVANALIAINLYPVFNELSFVQCEYNNNNNNIIFIYFRHIIHACTICPYDI